MNITLTTAEIATILDLLANAEDALEDEFTFTTDDPETFEDLIKTFGAIRAKLTEVK